MHHEHRNQKEIKVEIQRADALFSINQQFSFFHPVKKNINFETLVIINFKKHSPVQIIGHKFCKDAPGPCTHSTLKLLSNSAEKYKSIIAL